MMLMMLAVRFEKPRERDADDVGLRAQLLSKRVAMMLMMLAFRGGLQTQNLRR